MVVRCGHEMLSRKENIALVERSLPYELWMAGELIHSAFHSYVPAKWHARKCKRTCKLVSHRLTPVVARCIAAGASKALPAALSSIKLRPQAFQTHALPNSQSCAVRFSHSAPSFSDFLGGLSLAYSGELINPMMQSSALKHFIL